MKLKLIAILFLIKINAFVAQNNYKVDGNSLPNNAVLGSTNNQGFKIITDNQTTIDIDNSGKVKFKKSVKFDDKFVADSIRVNNYIVADSIKTRILKVGNNSLLIGGSPFGVSDNIQSTIGVLNFGRSTPPFQNINVSIGSAFTGPFSAARARLFVNGRTGINVTNPLSTLGVSGNAAFGAGFGGSNAPVNGLIVEGYTGIGVVAPATQLEIFSPFPNAQFRISRFLGQRFTDFESTTSGDMFIAPKDLTLLGNAQQRFVGIHTNTPGNSLEINSQATSTA